MLAPEQTKQMYNQISEIRNQVITEKDTTTLDTLEYSYLLSLYNKLTTARDEFNTYFKAHNNGKNIWE